MRTTTVLAVGGLMVIISSFWAIHIKAALTSGYPLVVLNYTCSCMWCPVAYYITAQLFAFFSYCVPPVIILCIHCIQLL